ENFVGRKALEPQRNTTPKQVLVGLTSQQRRAGRAGSPILVDGQPVGEITSGIPSPTLSTPVALGYIQADHATPGTQIEVDVRGKNLPFTVTKPPFYTR